MNPWKLWRGMELRGGTEERALERAGPRPASTKGARRGAAPLPGCQGCDEMVTTAESRESPRPTNTILLFLPGHSARLISRVLT